MIPTESGFHTYNNHILENSKNFINFSTNTECEKEQIEYSYFELEKVFGARKASFINRLNYWLNKCGKDIDSLFGKWIYNPTHEWAEQLNCSPSTIKRLIKSLEEQGIVLSEKVNAKKYNQTKWYSLNYKLLQSILKLENTDTKATEKKWTNRLGQNEPIIISNNRNNYTNNISSIDKIDVKINELINKKIEEKLDDILKRKVANSDENQHSSLFVIQNSNLSLDTKEQLIEENSKKELSPTKEEYKKKKEIIKEIGVSSTSADLTNTDSSYEKVVQIFTEPKPIKEGDNTHINKKEDDLYLKEVNTFPDEDNLQALQKKGNESKESKGIAEKMKETWDKVFQYSLNPIKAYLNKKTIIQLPQLLKDKFNNNLSDWEEYAKQVNSSQFLMGEKETKNNFKAVFPWLIKEETIDSIQQGAYGVGDRELDINNLDKNIKEKEYEIRIEANKKISQYLENNIDKEKEEREFKEYLMNEKYEEDEDKYKVKNYMEKVSKYQMYGFYVTPSHFYHPGNEKHKEKIFHSYLMKKHLGFGEIDIKNHINKKIKKQDSKSVLFGNMVKISNKIKKLIINKDIARDTGMDRGILLNLENELFI